MGKTKIRIEIERIDDEFVHLMFSECNHVIDGHRTFITALSHGRNPNVKLRATYQIIERLDFQVNLFKTKNKDQIKVYSFVSG